MIHNNISIVTAGETFVNYSVVVEPPTGALSSGAVWFDPYTGTFGRRPMYEIHASGPSEQKPVQRHDWYTPFNKKPSNKKRHV